MYFVFETALLDFGGGFVFCFFVCKVQTPDRQIFFSETTWKTEV